MTSIYTETFTFTLSWFNDHFAGTYDSPDYDDIRSLKLDMESDSMLIEWTRPLQLNFLNSILNGYYIPPIICSQRDLDRCERTIIYGANTIINIRKLLNGDIRKLTDEEITIISSFNMQLIIMHNLTTTDKQEVIEQINLINLYSEK